MERWSSVSSVWPRARAVARSPDAGQAIRPGNQVTGTVPCVDDAPDGLAVYKIGLVPASRELVHF